MMRDDTLSSRLLLALGIDPTDLLEATILLRAGASPEVVLRRRAPMVDVRAAAEAAEHYQLTPRPTPQGSSHDPADDPRAR